MAGHLTPDQKAACSNRVRDINFFSLDGIKMRCSKLNIEIEYEKLSRPCGAMAGHLTPDLNAACSNPVSVIIFFSLDGIEMRNLS